MHDDRLNVLLTSWEGRSQPEHPGFIALPVTLFGQTAAAPWALHQWAYEQAKAELDAARFRRDLFVIMN